MSSTDALPDRVGPFRLIEMVGEGGMGIVYKAEQTGAIQRTVALKLIKAGMDSKQVIARFDVERQALAMMNHPSIATVYDAGMTEEGRPYFVMEFVDGLSLTDYCMNHRLPLRERLRLFVNVCDAVQHAHQKGIIHRDLKPCNVLVVEDDSGGPLVKVIDFGIAKATQAPLTERTLVTNFSQVMGSPAYMSPEQADLSGLDVDTRTDIYALGVLLYELITGQLPIDRERFSTAGLAEIQRLLWEVEPPRPSRRLTSLGGEIDAVSASQGTTPAKLLESTKGDLDWIVMRAIEKDRARRYASATGFAEDVERFLNHEPVKATPPSAGYLLRKFVRRHRSGVTTAVAVSGLLITTTGFSIWQAIRATKAEEREALEKQAAQTQAAIASETVEFLRLDLLGQASPNQQPDPDIRLRTVLDRAAASLEGRFEGQPLVKADLLITVGQTYMGIGEYELATTFLKRGRGLWVPHHGEDHERVLVVDSNLADCLSQERRYGEAVVLQERIWRKRKAQFGPDALGTLKVQTDYANSLMRLGQDDLAISLLENAAQSWDAKDPAFLAADPERRSLRRWITYGVLGAAYQQAGRLALAERLLKMTLEGMQVEFGMDSPSTLVTLGNYAAAIANQGRMEEALPLLDQSLTLSRKVRGERSTKTLRLLHEVGAVSWILGHRERGMRLLREAYDKRRERLGLRHIETLSSAKQFAEMLWEAEENDEGVRLALGILPAAHEHLGGSHEITNWAADLVRDHADLKPLAWQALLRDLAGEETWPSDRTRVLISKGAVWRYDDGGRTPEGWSAHDFDATAWPTGAAPLGYGERAIVTTIGFGRDPDQKLPSACFRTMFILSDSLTVEKLRLKIRRDDGAVVYLNGNLVVSHHVEVTREGKAALKAYATDTVGGLEEQLYYTSDIDPSYLLDGRNVLGVQVHQCNGGSSDLFIDLELEGLETP